MQNLESNESVKVEESCDPHDIALKSFFLGPKAENADWVKELFLDIFDQWFEWRESLYTQDGNVITEQDQRQTLFIERKRRFKQFLKTISNRFQSEVPNFTPRYIGHMNNEISLPGLMGHVISLLHNPNNISGEASRVGIVIENEAISDLAEMIGFDEKEARGHFTSGGTVANFEGALRARARFARWMALGAYLRKNQLIGLSLMEAAHMGWQRYDELMNRFGLDEKAISEFHYLENNPIEIAGQYQEIFESKYRGPVILVPNNKHYSWKKAASFLGLGLEAFWSVELNRFGKMSVADLRNKIEKAKAENRPVMMVVSVAGTTEMGDFDPIDKVADLLDEYRETRGLHIWHHVDAAYGGYFCSLPRIESEFVSRELLNALDGMRLANSITIDPHKLGYVPYSSGAFICADKREYFAQKIDAPYIKFDENRDKGTQTLEGSRSAAGAVSTWLTSKSIGLNADGYGRILELTMKSRMRLQQLLEVAHPMIRVAPYSETNVLCFCLAEDGEAVSESNRKTEKIYERFSSAKNNEYFVSQTNLNWDAYKDYLRDYTREWNAQKDTQKLTLIRMVLMNPFFITKEGNIDYPEDFVGYLVDEIKKFTDV